MMKAPKPLPSSDPIPFATTEFQDAVWPIVTSHAQKFEVNYRATDDADMGSSAERQFFATRRQGTRHHVGVDLFANHCDKIVACENGCIVSYYGFYPTATG